MTIGAVEVFESLQENFLIFDKISTRDNRGSSSFRITSTKLLYFEKISTRDNRGSSSFHELNFLKNKAIFLRWFENLNCTYCHELTFSKK